jgi:nucleotide-binding universal stress UspA family protein
MTGSRRFLPGSVAAKVAHHAPSSALIARTG